MTRNMQTKLLAWALVVTGVGILLSSSHCEAAGQKTPNVNMLHMGLATTPSGEYQYLTNPDVGTSSLVVLLAVLHFNERYGGILPVFETLRACDARIRLVGGRMRDDQGLSNVAMNDFINLRAQPRETIDIVHGSVRSDVTIPLAVTTGALHIPQISYFASSEELSNQDMFPLFFRTIPSDQLRIKALANLFQNWGYKKVGMIYSNEAFGLSWRTGLNRECSLRGIRLNPVSYDYSVTGSALDEQIQRGLKILVEERINVIVHISLNANFLYALSRSAKALNWVKGKLYIGHSNYFQSILRISTTSDRVLEAMNGSLVIGATLEENTYWRSLREHWRQTNASLLRPYLPDTKLANGERFSLSDDFFQLGHEKDKFRSWAYAYDSVAAIGLAACFDSEGDLASRLNRTELHGCSGFVEFGADANRGGPSGTKFSLVNLLISPEKSSVESREVGISSMDFNWTLGTIIFSDGSSTPPRDVEPPHHEIDELPIGFRILGWVEAAIAMTLGLVSLVYVNTHQKEKIIVESQPIFMTLMAIGCIFVGASIIPMTYDSDAGCMLMVWLFVIGFSLIVSALGAKSVRVAILWYHRGPIRERRQAAKVSSLLSGITAILVFEVVVLLAWQIVAPLRFEMRTSQYDDAGNPLYSSCSCASVSASSTVFFALIVVFVCVIVFGVMWISFWVRNAPEKFHETKMSAVAAVSMFQVFFVGIPSIAVVSHMVTPRFIVFSSLAFLICLLVLGTMFFPKIFKSYLSSMNNSSASKNSHDAGGSKENYPQSDQQRNGARSDVRAVRSVEDLDNLHDYPSDARIKHGIVRVGLYHRHKSGKPLDGSTTSSQNRQEIPNSNVFVLKIDKANGKVQFDLNPDLHIYERHSRSHTSRVDISDNAEEELSSKLSNPSLQDLDSYDGDDPDHHIVSSHVSHPQLHEGTYRREGSSGVNPGTLTLT